MGGTVALMHAATGTHRPDAVAAVSAASRWWTRETEAMRRLFWLAEQPHGRALIRALRVRMAEPLKIIPPSPVEVVDRIAPTPVLLVHGTEDHYVPVDHALALHRASGAELWALDGMRHAETAMSPALVDRISDWLHTNTRERLAV
jgi:dipeptidyl aminopeptidase/acylaminoacyl peptidase